MPEPTARRVAVTSAIRHVGPSAVSGYLRDPRPGAGSCDLRDAVAGEHLPRRSTRIPAAARAGRARRLGPRRPARVANAERLFVFDPSWRLVAELSDRLMSDVHDVLAEEHGIWVAATGCDLLLLVTWDGRIEHDGRCGGDRKLLRELGFRERPLRLIDPAIDGATPGRVPRLRAAPPEQPRAQPGRPARVARPPRPGTSSRSASSPRRSCRSRQEGTRLGAVPPAVDGRARTTTSRWTASSLVYNDSDRDCLVAVDRRKRRRALQPCRSPATPSWARGLARVGRAAAGSSGSQAPLARLRGRPRPGRGRRRRTRSDGVTGRDRVRDLPAAGRVRRARASRSATIPYGSGTAPSRAAPSTPRCPRDRARAASTSCCRHVQHSLGVAQRGERVLRVLDLERGEVTFMAPVPESAWRAVDPNPRGGARGARGVSATASGS